MKLFSEEKHHINSSSIALYKYKEIIASGCYLCCDNIVFALANASSVSWFNYFTQLWQKLQYLHSHW